MTAQLFGMGLMVFSLPLAVNVIIESRLLVFASYLRAHFPNKNRKMTIMMTKMTALPSW